MSHHRNMKVSSGAEDKSYQIMTENRKFFQSVIESCMAGEVDVMDRAIHQYLSENKSIKMIDIVQDFKSEGKNLLHIAASSGHTNSLQYFLENCPKVKDIVNIRDDNGMTAIMNATISENEVNMKSLIDLGCDVNIANKDGATALHFAAGDGSVPRMQVLMDAGANLSASSHSGNALHWAASKGHTAAVEFLLASKQIDVNEVNSQGLPAVLLAAVANSDSCVESLVKAGADTGHILSDNLTILHICAENGLSRAVSEMLKTSSGAKCALVATNDGNLPIHYAAMSGLRDIIAALLPHCREQVLSTLSVSKDVSEEKLIDAIVEDGKVRLDAWNKKHEQAAGGNSSSSNSSSAPAGRELPTSAVDPTEATKHKDKGNDFFKKKEYTKALAAYTKAIELHGTEAAYWSNRSACYLAMNDAENALKDAEVCRQLNPTWTKGCYRLAAARLALQRYEDAAVAAFEGLKLDDKNVELKKILELSVKLGQEEFRRNSGKKA